MRPELQKVVDEIVALIHDEVPSLFDKVLQQAETKIEAYGLFQHAMNNYLKELLAEKMFTAYKNEIGIKPIVPGETKVTFEQWVAEAAPVVQKEIQQQIQDPQQVLAQMQFRETKNEGETVH